ncbi:thermonuclease family protein [Desulfuromusa kysingii]|uniref:thermonuclease family protein n=1 Tax=Desulfuromusa kysingii TaxID=37625 RepID=UPI0015877D40|nr:thermonuclease family protein [Desulfuromusa kysingii]
MLLIMLFLLISSASAAELTGKVIWVYDGDTLKVENIGKVRLLGIDAPEYKASSRDHFYKKNFNIEANQLRRIAQQAKKYLMAKVKGQTVRLVFDGNQKDKYNRFLAYVYLPDGRMLNRILLERGLATVFRRDPFQHKKDFLTIEKRAQNKQRGVWKKSSPQKFSLFNFWSQNSDGHPLLPTTTY